MLSCGAHHCACIAAVASSGLRPSSWDNRMLLLFQSSHRRFATAGDAECVVSCCAKDSAISANCDKPLCFVSISESICSACCLRCSSAFLMAPRVASTLIASRSSSSAPKRRNASSMFCRVAQRRFSTLRITTALISSCKRFRIVLLRTRCGQKLVECTRRNRV